MNNITMKTLTADVTVRNKQSLLDIAIQYRGTAAAAFELAVANDISITNDLVTGQQLVISETRYYNKTIADYYKGKGILPATAVTDEYMDGIFDPGIGEMIINQTFIVH